MVRAAARSMAFLVCVDGLASYVTAFARVFRDPVRTGRAGRPRLVATAGLLLGQVIKHRAGRCLTGRAKGLKGPMGSKGPKGSKGQWGQNLFFENSGPLITLTP